MPMSATTVKLNATLMRRIAKFKARRQTVASFVRNAIEGELRRRQMRSAAETYQKLLRQQRGERQEMKEWEKADLTSR